MAIARRSSTSKIKEDITHTVGFRIQTNQHLVLRVFPEVEADRPEEGILVHNIGNIRLLVLS